MIRLIGIFLQVHQRKIQLNVATRQAAIVSLLEDFFALEVPFRVKYIIFMLIHSSNTGSNSSNSIWFKLLNILNLEPVSCIFGLFVSQYKSKA